MDYQPKVNVTDKIGGQETEWKSGDIVLISAGTGSGKSFFIRNTLEQQAEKTNSNILLLVNRKRLFDQSIELIGDSLGTRIKVELYQSIENQINQGKSYDLSTYKYIVCDESHYFTSDSGFNDNSDDSLNAILETNAVKVFMSATGDVLFSHLKQVYRKILKKTNNEIWSYSLPKNYSNIASLNFYSDFASVEHTINNKLKPDDKVIYFADRIEKAYNLHMKYKDESIFICSTSNKEYSKHIDEKKVSRMVRENRFNCKFLFTTKVLDSGFDLKDESIKLIICDMFDIETMLQCIGRKRPKDTKDKVHVILLNHTNQNVYNYSSKLVRKIEEVDLFIKEGVDGWKRKHGKYGKSGNYMIYDTVTDGKYKSAKKFSRVKYLQAQAESERNMRILNENKEDNKRREMVGEKKVRDAYQQYVAGLLKKSRFYVLDELQEQDELSRYLETLIGKYIYKHDQNEIIEKFNIKDYRGRVQKDINQLQSYLASNEMKYLIRSYEDKRRKLEDDSINPNRDKSYWMVSRIVNN